MIEINFMGNQSYFTYWVDQLCFLRLQNQMRRGQAWEGRHEWGEKGDTTD